MGSNHYLPKVTYVCKVVEVGGGGRVWAELDGIVEVVGQEVDGEPAARDVVARIGDLDTGGGEEDHQAENKRIIVCEEKVDDVRDALKLSLTITPF